jgi:menaquinol-cytochrome c reductase iron-sulfur subunit
MTRRTFYERTIVLLGGLLNAALGLPAVAYLLGPAGKEENPGWSDAGSISALPDGRPAELTVHREQRDAWKKSVEKLKVWAVKHAEADVTVFVPQCTHLGCGYRWIAERELFLCPCHDSTFSIDGEVLSGPAPRRLDRFETRIEGGRVWIGAPRQDEA